MPTFEPRVSLITLGVSDLARSRAFYETGLGWKASPASQGDVVFFQAGALAVALFPRNLLAEDAGVPAEGAGFSGITFAHNVREPADVDRLLAVAEKPPAPGSPSRRRTPSGVGAPATSPIPTAIFGRSPGILTSGSRRTEA